MSYSHGAGLAHQAMLKRMSSSFEEPFAHETMSQFDQMSGADGMPESPSVDRDSRYLSFSMPSFLYRLYNESFQQCHVNIQAQLHGMFFLAESQWPTTMDTAPPPPELTCYRRNLFQITGNVTIPRSLRYIFIEDGRRLPIYDMELHVSATESVEGNPVKIISVPWKNSSGAESAKQDEKAEKEPPAIVLDKLAASDMDSDFNMIPVQWKRLQFRIATANNGRRKELQQHFTLHLKVMATVSTGEKMTIAESHSGAVIVRGRSPRNFAARKDVPLSSSSTSRKHVPSLSRSGESTASLHQITSAPKQGSPNEQILRSHPVFDSGDLQRPEVDLNGWQQAVPPFTELSSTPYSQSAPMYPPAPMSFTGVPSPDIAQTPFGFAFSPDLGQNVSAPISLHFASEDEGSNSPYPQQQSSRTSSRPPTSNPSPSLMNKPRSATYAHASSPKNITSEPPFKQRPRLQHNTSAPISNGALSASAPPMSTGVGVQFDQHTHPPMHQQRPPLLNSVSHVSHQSHDRANVNGLYEYFPLSIDEWQPPVDAVFQTHIVHHEISLDSSMRSPGVMSGRSSKRCFSEVI